MVVRYLGIPIPLASVTFDPAAKNTHVALSSGNSIATIDAAVSSSLWEPVLSTAFASTGKRYCEFHAIDGAKYHLIVGMAQSAQPLGDGNYIGVDANGYGYMGTGGGGGLILHGGGSTSEGAYFSAGAVVGMMVDFGALTIQFAINNVLQGSPYAIAAGSYCPAAAVWSSSGTTSVGINSGSSAFTYAPPSGYLPWNA